MRSIFILSIVLFSQQGFSMGPPRPQLPDNTPSATASADPYYQRFLELGKLYSAAYITNSVSFSYRYFFGSTIGMCTTSSNGKNSVALSSTAWPKGSDTFKEMLMFHELGHCLLGRGHTNSTHSDGRPESLMRSALFSQSTYLKHRDEYLKELFTAENHALSSRWLLRSRDHVECEWGKK